MTIDRKAILLALDHQYPDGFEGLDAAKPTPSNYAEYVDSVKDGFEVMTEAEMQAAATTELDRVTALKQQRQSLTEARATMAADFNAASAATRAKYYATRAAVELALDYGDVEAAAGILNDLSPQNQEEADLKAKFLNLIGG